MSKRILAAGVVAVAVFAAAAYAQASLKTYTDPQGRFTFQYPASLPVDVTPRPAALNIIVGAAAYECQIFAVARPESDGKPPGDVVRAYTPAFTSEIWKRSADGFALYGRKGTVQSNTVDTTKFWPVQHASLTTDEGKPVVAAMQARPGVDVWQFCTGFDNADHTATFNQIISSFAAPNDAALQAQAEADAAARSERAAANAAAAEANAAAAAAAAEKGKATPHKASRGRGLKEKD